MKAPLGTASADRLLAGDNGPSYLPLSTSIPSAWHLAGAQSTFVEGAEPPMSEKVAFLPCAVQQFQRCVHRWPLSSLEALLLWEPKREKGVWRQNRYYELCYWLKERLREKWLRELSSTSPGAGTCAGFWNHKDDKSSHESS